jgi:hypothetical protein
MNVIFDIIVTFLIPIGILVFLLSIPFGLVKLTELEKVENHWWNLTWTYYSKNSHSIVPYICFTLYTPIISAMLLSAEELDELMVVYAIFAIFGMVAIVRNRNVIKAHKFDRRLRIWTALYLLYLVATSLFFIVEMVPITFLLITWFPCAVFWGFRVVIGCAVVSANA